MLSDLMKVYVTKDYLPMVQEKSHKRNKLGIYFTAAVVMCYILTSLFLRPFCLPSYFPWRTISILQLKSPFQSLRHSNQSHFTLLGCPKPDVSQLRNCFLGRMSTNYIASVLLIPAPITKKFSIPFMPWEK